MATASLVQFLFAGVKDSLGNPLASGTARFYVPGSTSETITIYADREATQQLSQPVTLDAGGAAEVYVKLPCEIIVKDSLGVQQKLTANGATVEDAQVNVTWGGTREALSVALTAMETNLGSGAAYVESAATGVVPRKYNDVVHTAISPYDFGAVGDGTTDDTVPVQRALNRANATKLPLLLDGSFKITSTVSVVATIGDIVIIGTGPDASGLVASSFTGTALSITGGYVHLADFAVVSARGASNAAISVDGGHLFATGVYVSGSFYGISSTVPALLVSCQTYSCDTGFNVSGATSGCVGCWTASTTHPLPATISGGAPIDIGNSWSTTSGGISHTLSGAEASASGVGSLVSARVSSSQFTSDISIDMSISIPNGSLTTDLTTITFSTGLIASGISSVVASNGYVCTKPATRQIAIAPPATTSGTTTVYVTVKAY